MKRPLVTAALAALASIVACGSDFAPKNAVLTIRILAARADIPYARPGETVKLQALVHDGRSEAAAKQKPMRFFWIPAPCINPPGDQYFACYFGLSSLFPAGQDLTPALVESTETSVTIPDAALDGVIVRPGTNERFATAYMFMVACAGHVERIVPQGGLAVNALPVACFDDAGNRLGPDEFVVGFTRVFVFETRRNALPTLGGLTYEGQPVDPKVGISTGGCVKDDQGKCKTVKLDATFADADAETDPDNVDENGKVGRETIYVDWFTTVGKLESDRKVLFDGNLGRAPKTPVEYTPPGEPGKGTLWAILHDNRGGTNWLEVPLEIK